MAAHEHDRERIELATARVRERTARIELHSAIVEWRIARLKFAGMAVGVVVAVATFLLRA